LVTKSVPRVKKDETVDRVIGVGDHHDDSVGGAVRNITLHGDSGNYLIVLVLFKGLAIYNLSVASVQLYPVSQSMLS
jgi:hypothetical protein